MPRGEQTKAPNCKLCGTEHWSYEPHSMKVVDSTARVVEPVPAITGQAPENKRPRGRPKKSIGQNTGIKKSIGQNSVPKQINKGGIRRGAGRPKKVA